MTLLSDDDDDSSACGGTSSSRASDDSSSCSRTIDDTTANMGHTGGDEESMDTLYRAMEMAEEMPSQAPTPAVANEIPAPAFHPTTDDPAASSTNLIAGSDLPLASSNNPVTAEEDEIAFFWVLLDFARKRSWKKKLLTVLIVCSSVYVLTDILFLGNVVPFVNSFLNWMTQHTVLAIIVCVLFFAAATLVFVPHAILTFGAGWAFSNVLGFGLGLFIGLFVSFMGSSLGAVLSFVRSRYMMRDLVELFAERYPIVKATDRAIQRKGFKIFLLLRLCPIVPFNLLNYLGGVTSVSMEEYSKALIGILPITLLWTTVGASADRMTDRSTDDFGERFFLIGLLLIGILCGIAALSRVYKYARDELLQEIEFDRAESWRKYKRSSSSTLESGERPIRGPSPEDQGIEVLNRADATLLAVLGIDGFAVEAQRPPDKYDEGEDPFWYWA